MRRLRSNWLKLLILGAALIFIYRLFSNFNSLKALSGKFLRLFSPIAIGVIIAFFLYLPQSSLEKKISSCKWHFAQKHSRIISITLLYLALLLAVVPGVIYIVPGIYQSLEELLSRLPEYTASAKRYLSETKYLSSIDLYKLIDINPEGFFNLQRIGEYLTYAKNVIGFFVSAFVSLVMSVYLLTDRERIINYLSRLCAAVFGTGFAKAAEYIRRIITLFYSYFAGIGADSLIVGVIAAAGFALLGVPYPLLLGTVMALGNTVPIFGTLLSVVITSIISLISGGFFQLVTVLLFLLTLYVFDAYFIQPKIVGKSTGLRPVAVLTSIIVFGNLFGIAGIILGVPVTATIKMFVDDYIASDLKNPKL